MSLQNISQWLRGVGASAIKRKNRRRLQKQGRRILASEQLENRRLMVADLVNFLTQEHVDINIQNTSGVWNVGPRNSDAAPEIQYANDEAVMYVGTPAVTARPAGSNFDFIGVPSGSNFYLLPQSQDTDLLYLGFAAYGVSSSTVDRYVPTAESKGRISSNARWVKASLSEVRHTSPDGSTGDGAFSLWQTGTFGSVSVYMSSYNDATSNPDGNGLDTTDGISADDAMWIVAGGHAHFNYGFTKPGRYEVDLKLSAYFGDDGLTTPNASGFSQSEKITVYFSVISVGQLEIDEASYTVNEGAGTVSVNVVRVGGSDGRVTVDYATSNGSALAGSDYTTTSGTLEFLDGETSKTIVVPILNDSTEESSESFSLVLSNPKPDNIDDYVTSVEGDANGILGAVASAVITIVDNDQNTPPNISNVSDQSTDEDIPTAAIPFTVGDSQTPVGSLIVTASSDNTVLIPNANIVVGGSGANRTVTISPAANLFGTATVTLTVTDAGGLTATDTFVVTVNPINDKPTISDVTNQWTPQDTATGAITFSISDIETTAAALTVSGTSSNLALVPNANIVLGGNGSTRTVSLIPAVGQAGSTTITLTVEDENGATSTDTFLLIVGGSNELPSISDISDQNIDEDQSTGNISFTVGDVKTNADALVVTATSSNTTLVPNGNISLSGSGVNRIVRITPVNNLFGSTTITLTVTDEDGFQSQDTFVLAVNPVNDLPTISDIADLSIIENSSTNPIPFIVGDLETLGSNLTVSATSSNTSLVPNSNIELAGSGANRTVKVTPLPGESGAATITITVTDEGGLQASETFLLTVGAVVRATFDKSVGIVFASEPDYVDVHDMDADGDLDILYTQYNQSISVLPNNGDGTFDTGVSLPALTVSEFKVADVDGDNLLDIVSSVYTDTTYAETAIAIWRNLGAGIFSGIELIPTTRSSGFVGLVGVGDIDGDGRNDIVLTNNGLSWIRNLGTGTFGSAVDIFSGRITYASDLNDIDQDGDLDIVRVSNFNDEFQLQVSKNSGTSSPSFSTSDIATFGTESSNGLAIGDTNQDGFADIHLLKGSSNRQIIVLHGSLSGDFGSPMVLGSGPDLRGLVIGDLDDDGRPDLALTAMEQNKVQFLQNLGDGTYSELQEIASDIGLNPYPGSVAIGDIDSDSRMDLVFAERFGFRVAWARNRQEENITALTPPSDRTYLNGYPMVFDVFLGFNAKVNTSSGSPTLQVTIGSQVVQVPYVGQPNPNILRFQYQVEPTDIDLDGIEVSSSIQLNGALVTDIYSRPIDSAFLQLPMVDTTGVLVNGSAPYVTGISRLDPNPVSGSPVRFEVTFSEAVTGVTIDDFVLDASGVVGAAINSFSGSGNTYTVTANVGTGEGTLRVRVVDNDSIVDTSGFQLGGVGIGNGEFAYGQGYTVRSTTATPTFSNVVADGHLDLVLQFQPGDWYGFWYGEGWWETNETLISASEDARSLRPAESAWDFLGAGSGEPVWIFPETYSTTTPWPGVGTYFNGVGDFASYFESDSRINKTAPWIKLQLLDVRGPEGGDFSLYQSGLAGPKVFMSSADGIDANDAAWIPNLEHVHYNWAFSKQGLYQIDLAASGFVDVNKSGAYEAGIDPLAESQIITVYFGIELPKAESDSFSVADDTTLKGSVTLNDRWASGYTANVPADISTSVVTTTTKGSLTLQSDGAFTYVPSTMFDGVDSFSYRLNTPWGSSIATVTITEAARPAIETILFEGHTDIGVNFEDDAWDLHIHDEEQDVEYETHEAQLMVGEAGRTTRTGDSALPAYDFLGIDVGEEFFVLAEVENPELLFLGLGTEELADGIFVGDNVTFHLQSVAGPGHFSVWRSGLTPATPNKLMVSSDGISNVDAIDLASASHRHLNFAFSEPGLYEVTFVASGLLNAGTSGEASMSAPVTYFFRVGNNAPTANNESLVLSRENTLYGNVLINDSDVDGDTYQAQLVTAPSKGTLSLSLNGGFVYVPSSAFDGIDSFTYSVVDEFGAAATATVSIVGSTDRTFEAILKRDHADIGLAYEEDELHLHVHDHENEVEYHPDEALLFVGMEAIVNRDGPAADPAYDFLGVNVGESLFVLPEVENIDLLFLGIGGEEIPAGTFQNGSAQLRLVAVNGPGHFSIWKSGSTAPQVAMATSNGVTSEDNLSILEGGHSHYNYGFSKKGNYEVTFLASATRADGTDVSTGYVTYYFRAGNFSPSAEDDSFAVSPLAQLSGNVLFNDFDPEGDELTVAVVSSTAKGTLNMNADGSFSYVPSHLFNGSDSFIYSITDPFGATVTASVAITQASEREFLVSLVQGHADIGLAIEEGTDIAWDLHVHNHDTEEEFHPDEALLMVNANGWTVRSGGAAGASYDFLGVNAGQSFFMLPETENVNQLFLGIAAEEINAGTLRNASARLQLISVNGPGAFSVWNEELGGPVLRMGTLNGVGIDDFVIVPEGGHAHFNYGFSRAGSYEITVQAVGTLADGSPIVGDYVTYFFSVGNIAPSMTEPSDVTINEDAGLQQIELSGITAGAAEAQPLRMTATSNNPALIPNPSLSYTAPNSTGSLQYTPVANQSGTATITIRIEDGGLDGNLSTTGDNLFSIYEINVNVNAVNDQPTLAPISNRNLQEDASMQTVSYAGISAGGGESQPLRVIATSSNTGLIPNPSVNYSSPLASGTLTFTPVANQSGTAVITVTVEDGGLDGDLSTVGDNGSVSQTFVVSVNAVNDTPTLDPVVDVTINEDAAEQVVNLTGITAGGGESQPLRVVVTSSNTGLIPDPVLDYTSPNSAATLRFTPVANMFGTSVITVTVTDGGLDSNLSTTNGNLTFTRTFVVNVISVNDRPIAGNDSYQIFINGASDFDVRQNDSDVEDSRNSLLLEVVTQPQGGIVTVNDGQLRFVPNRTRLGSDSFTYRVIDTAGLASEVATVNLLLQEFPQTNPDTYWTAKNQRFIANVLANDIALVSPLVANSLALSNVTPAGSATIQNGQVRITPPTGYIGTVSFSYTVSNQLNIVSAVTSVTVNVLDRSFQNPQRRFDVNGDFYVTAMDALIIINELNRRGPRALNVLTDFAPPYYDVNGDFNLNASDALAVINHLNSLQFGGAGGASGEGEGELLQDDVANNSLSSMNGAAGQPGNDWDSLQDHVDAALIEMLAEDHQRRQRAWVKR
jgi:surface-anchored protein